MLLPPVSLYRSNRTLVQYQPYHRTVPPVPLRSPTHTLVLYHPRLPAVPTFDIPSNAWFFSLDKLFWYYFESTSAIHADASDDGKPLNEGPEKGNQQVPCSTMGAFIFNFHLDCLPKKWLGNAWKLKRATAQATPEEFNHKQNGSGDTNEQRVTQVYVSDDEHQPKKQRSASQRQWQDLCRELERYKPSARKSWVYG